MRDIVKEMLNEAQERLSWFGIGLSAVVTIQSDQFSITVQAAFFCPFFSVRQT